MQSNAGLSPLRGLAKLRQARTRRFSSWDRTGGNDDRLEMDGPTLRDRLQRQETGGCREHGERQAHADSIPSSEFPAKGDASKAMFIQASMR